MGEFNYFMIFCQRKISILCNSLTALSTTRSLPRWCPPKWIILYSCFPFISLDNKVWFRTMYLIFIVNVEISKLFWYLLLMLVNHAGKGNLRKVGWDPLMSDSFLLFFFGKTSYFPDVIFVFMFLSGKTDLLISTICFEKSHVYKPFYICTAIRKSKITDCVISA